MKALTVTNKSLTREALLEMAAKTPGACIPAVEKVHRFGR